MQLLLDLETLVIIYQKDKKRKQTWSHFEAYELIDKIELRAIVEINQKKIDFFKKKLSTNICFSKYRKVN